MPARLLAGAAILCLAALGTPAVAAAADEPPPGDDASPIFFFSSGELAAGETGKVEFTVASDDYTAAGNGRIGIGFTLEAAAGSTLDPGTIRVVSPSGPAPAIRFQKSSTPGGNASYAIAELSPGISYDVLIDSEGGTTGAYELSAFLAGDVNGDFQVNHDDLALIESLSVTKHGHRQYSVWADLNRNGVINRGDRMAAARNLGAATLLRPTVEHPLDLPLAADALRLDGVSPKNFNPVAAPLAFTLTGEEFFDDPAEVVLTVNGQRVAPGQLTMEPHRISVTSALVDGRNEIHFEGVDTIGRPLYHDATIWTGTNTLRVDVVDAAGSLVTDEVNVRVSLTDDQNVYAEAETTTGRVTFTNVPSRTVLVRATASGNRLGIAGLHAGQGAIRVKLLGFAAPSPIDNNDFSQGTAGWDIGNAPVTIVPHEEGFPAHLISFSPQLATTPDRQRPAAPLMEPANVVTTPARTAASAEDNDLVLSTRGDGEQAISRSFVVKPGSTTVRIRYRFITSEVPGGYFGSEYNDYFRVILRSQTGGAFVYEANSMNGLGLEAFDYPTGATDWREIALPVAEDGDVIHVDVGVANVGDGLYDSHVVVDVVTEHSDQINPALTWNDIQGGLNLTYEVERGDLTQPGQIEIYWASGPGYNDRIGSPIFVHSVPSGTREGTHGPIHIPGDLLADDPPGVTHLIAAAGPNRVGAVQDVVVTYGQHAKADRVWPEMLDLVKDGLRAAGAATATITSTARSSYEQARAMFNNLADVHSSIPTSPARCPYKYEARSIKGNIEYEKCVYGAFGDQVIDVFVEQSKDKTPEEIVADATRIRKLMEDKIDELGPSNVSNHAADPDIMSVVDVAANAFGKNGNIFMAAVAARATKVIDERPRCFHIELK